MKKPSRWFVLAVLVVNAIAAAFLTGAAQETEAPAAAAESAAKPDGTDAEPSVEPSREALRLLGEQLAVRAEQLRRREEALNELLRGPEVLRRAGLDPGAGDPSPAATAAAATTAARSEESPEAESPETEPAAEAFARLSRAYENMEPDSAALALIELAGIDRDAVVELLSGWRARVSGAILDSLAQANPTLAAELSYEIWKRSGKQATSVATSGR